MSTTDALIQSLGGDEAADGTFTLDRDRAREKMRLFQLPDPRSYVAELVAAAAQAGARRARFDIDADDMWLRFDGAPFEVEDFDHLWGSLLSSTGSSGPRRTLALGLNAAMALSPAHVRVESGAAGGPGAFLEMRPGQEDHFGALENGPGETRIHVKHRLRPGLLVRFVRNLTGTLTEEQILRQRCRYATVEVDLEGAVLSHGPTLGPDEAIAVVDIEQASAGLRGQVGLARGGRDVQKPARIELVRDSLWFATEERDELLPGLVAVVEANQLRKNVSQTDVVRDDHFQHVVATVERVQPQVLTAYAQSARETLDDVPRRLEELWRQLLAHRSRGWRPPSDCEALLELPLLHSSTGLPLSLSQLDQDREQRGHVALSSVQAEVELPAEWPLLVDTSAPADLELLRRVMDDAIEDWTDRVSRLRQRSLNHQRWLERPRAPKLTSGAAQVTVDLRAEGVSGQLGLLLTKRQPLHLGLIWKGHLLVEHTLEFPIPGLTAIIEADFKPTDLFDDVLRSPDEESFRRAAEALVDALPPLVQAAAALPGDDERLRDTLRASLALVGRPDGRRQALEALCLGAVEEVPGWPLAQALDSEELRRRPLLPCWDGSWLSLAALGAEIERFGHLRVVEPGVARLEAPDEVADPLWRRADRFTGDDQGLRDRPVLVMGPELEALTQPEQRRSVAAACRALVEAVEFDRRARRAIRARDQKHRWSVPVDAPRFTGSIWLDVEAGISGQVLVESSPTAIQEASREARPIGAVAITVPVRRLSGLVSTATSPESHPWGALVEGGTTEELRWAFSRALPSLFEQVGRHVDIFNDAELGAVLLDAVGALFPGPGHRLAYDAFRAHLAPEAAEAEYQALLEVGSQVTHDRLERRLANWPLDESLPTAATLRRELALEQSLFSDLTGPERDEGEGAPPGALAWVEVLFPPGVRGGQPLSFADRALESIAPLRTTKLFLDLNRMRITLQPLIDDYRDSGEVLYLTEPFPDAPQVDRPVVLLEDARHRQVLEQVFGPAALREASDWLEEQKRTWYRDRLPHLDRLALGDEAIVAVPIDSDGITGEVGLPREISGEEEPRLIIQLCIDRRGIGEQRARSLYIDLVAVLDDDQLVMNETWEAIAEDPRREDRVALCGAALPQLAVALADRWDQVDGADLEVAAGHALDLLAMRWVAASGRSEAFDDEPWQTLASRPLLASVDGRRWSIEQLREHSGTIVYRLDRSTRGELLDPDRLVLAIDDRELRRLEELGFENLTFLPLESWREEQKLVRWRAVAPPMPEPGQFPALHRIAVTDLYGIEGELFIPVSPSAKKPRVCFGFFGRQVEQRAISKVLPCAGVITGSELPVSEDLDAVKLTRTQAAALEHHAFRLYDELIARVADGDLTEAQAGDARRALAQLAVVLRRKRGPEWRPLLDKLEALEAFEPEPAAVATEPAAVATEPAAAEPAPALSLEARLLVALREELVRLRARNELLLSDFNLDKLELEPLPSSTGAVLCRWDQIVLNSQNQGVRRVLERFEHDPLWLAFLASAVYTAVNSHLEQVTDDDEAQFHHELAKSVLQR